MQSLELLGYIAGFIIAVSLTPQVVKSWSTRSTKDISIAWTFVYIVGLLLMLLYALGIESNPIIVTISIEIAMAVSLFAAKLKYG